MLAFAELRKCSSEVAFAALTGSSIVIVVNVMQHSGYQSLKAQMKKADNSGARFALIVAQDELANGMVTLKDMNGEHGQQTVAADDLIHTLQQWKNA